MRRTWIGLGSLAGLGAVMMAAVAAHLVPEDANPHTAEILRSAIQMQGWHAGRAAGVRPMGGQAGTCRPAWSNTPAPPSPPG